MNPKETIQAAKRIIKQRKINKNLWTKEDVLFAKMIKKKEKEKLADQNT
jgi:hypothetical protein